MTSFSPQQEFTATAVPGVSVAEKQALGMCTPAHSDSRLAVLIDQRRALAAQLAGKDMEIAYAVGDRDGAQRARREMEAQTVARCAARDCGCFFHDQGALDREKVEALHA
jgi:hypothetical protein